MTRIFAACLVFCFLAAEVSADSVLRRGGLGDPNTFDPHLRTSPWEATIIMDLFTGLVTLTAQDEWTPGAAQSWEVSPDGLTYTFTLRENLTWSDGTPMDSADWLYSFRRIMDPATAAAWPDQLIGIANGQEVLSGQLPVDELGVSAPDPRTVIITLVEPDPGILDTFAITALPVPRHAIESLGSDWIRPGQMVSNGAFVLTDWRLGDRVTVTKNQQFFEADLVALDAVEHVVTEDVNTGFQRFRVGDLDAIVTFPMGRLDWIKDNMPESLRLAPGFGIERLIFNLTRPPFDDVRVRQALAMAIDREILTESVSRGGEAPAYGYITGEAYNIGEVARVDWAEWPVDRRLEEARRLLAEAGFGPGNPLVVRYRYNTTEQHRRIAAAISGMWRRIGVQAELLNSELAILASDIRSGNFDVARNLQLSPTKDAATFLRYFQSDSGPLNYSRYRDPEFDALFLKVRKTVDLTERAGYLRDAEAHVLNDLPAIPLYFYAGRRLVKPYVTGWEDNPRGIHLARWMDIEEQP